MNWRQFFTDRELKEIEFCELYERDFAHGTEGHIAKIIIAKFAVLLADEAFLELDRPMDTTQLIAYLRTQAHQAGTQNDLAAKAGVSVTNLNLIINQRIPVGDKLLKALGIKKVVYYVKESIDA